MIDSLTGAVTFDDGLKLDPTARLNSFEAVSGAQRVSTISSRSHWSIGTRRVGDSDWGVGVVFVEATLQQVWLQCLTVPGVQSDVLELPNELKRKYTHDVVLLELFDKGNLFGQKSNERTLTFELPWGRVSSTLDQRGVQALILVEYR
jgi:hypothetical protein